MGDIITTSVLIPVIAIGYVVYTVLRIILGFKLRKQRKEYEALIEQKMATLQDDIQARARDLQSSMQMIQHEYSNLMSDMTKTQQQSAEELTQKLHEYKDRITPDDGSPPDSSSHASG